MDKSTRPEPFRRPGMAPWQRSAAIMLMTERLAVGIRGKALAQACHLSISAFGRAFFRETGTTPHRWLLAQRVSRAQELMRDSALALCDIALEVGFADQSHFSRVFARQTGTSPGAWRREQRRSAGARDT